MLRIAAVFVVMLFASQAIAETITIPGVGTYVVPRVWQETAVDGTVYFRCEALVENGRLRLVYRNGQRNGLEVHEEPLYGFRYRFDGNGGRVLRVKISKRPRDFELPNVVFVDP